MSLYDRIILPILIRLACGVKPISRQRGLIIPLARGRVLEVGVGSGLNFPYYVPERIEKVWGLDPSADIRAYAEREAKRLPFETEFLAHSGESIPLEDETVDTVVVTYTLCTIPDVRLALAEMRRVLKPEGRLLFCEHGEAPDPSVRRWQHRLTPVWKRVAGGCHLNRPVARLIESQGFRLTSLETEYLPGPRPMTFTYRGVAAKSTFPAGLV